MPAEEFREMTDDELNLRESELRKEIFNLRFQLATAQIENPMRIRRVKRDLARLLTVRREREMGVEIPFAVEAAAAGHSEEAEEETSE